MNVNLPDGWSSELVGEVSRKVAKIEPSSLGRETFTYVDIGSIDNSSHRVVSPQVIQVGDAPGRARQHVEFGDTVFSTVRPYLRNIAWIDESLDGQIASTGFCVLRAGNRLDARFLFFFSVSDALLDQVLPLQRGVSYPAVRDKDVFAAWVPLPPIEEQREIVRILEEQFSHLDAAAASISAVRRKADQFRRSILHAAFSGGLTQHGACRMNPAEDQTSSIPDSWMIKTIGDVASYVRGVTYDKSLSRTSPAKGYTPLLRATNIDSGALILEDFVYVPEDIVKAEQLLKIGDLVIAASSGSSSVVGKSAPIVTDFSGTFGAFCAVLRADLAISNKYLGYYIQSHSVRELWSSLARGTNINNLKRDQVCSTPIAVPPRNEQDEIVRILEEQFSRQEAILTVADAADRKVAALRRSLFHAAFSGELTKLWREESYG